LTRLQVQVRELHRPWARIQEGGVEAHEVGRPCRAREVHLRHRLAAAESPQIALWTL
jgi:hypothetical protein